MTARPIRLHSVKPSAETRLDITLALRSEIEARDWSAVHIQGDRSKPLPWFERIKRTWSK